MSSGSGGSTGTQPNPSGGAAGGSGGNASTTKADAAAGGVVGTGGVTGTGGAVDAPLGTDVASGTGGGTGGASTTSGAGGTSANGGSGGTSAAGGSGGLPLKLDAASGGAAGAGLDAGTAGSSGCDKDLSGTWDLFGSSLGTGIVRGTLVVSKDGFSLSTSRAQLTYNAQNPMSATWKYDGYSGPTTRVISVQNTPAAANTGSFPVVIGGHWVLQSNRETCTLDVAADKVTGNCTVQGASDHTVGGADWPWELMDSPENRLHYTIARSDALASQFGDFGGDWTARSDSGSNQGCTIKLEGNTASTSCRASNSFNGNLQLTIGADCVASGVTPGGLEVSARRR
jgi:hypothetical protein